MGFALKKVLGALLMPLPFLSLLLLAGLLFRWRKRPQLARAFLVGSAVLFWLASCDVLASAGVARLEGRYPAFPGDSVEAVVVLGGGHVTDMRLPPGARLSGQALYRLTEGLRIANDQPWATVILSGWGAHDALSNAEAYRAVAVSLAFDTTRIVLEGRPRDTAEEARLLTPRLAGRRFALVTSATHMPRAMTLFEAAGLTPVAAPTGHLTKEGRGWNWQSLFPQERALLLTRQLWYELLGSAWVRLRGQG